MVGCELRSRKGLLEMLGMFQCTEYYTLDLDEKI